MYHVNHSYGDKNLEFIYCRCVFYHCFSLFLINSCMLIEIAIMYQTFVVYTDISSPSQSYLFALCWLLDYTQVGSLQNCVKPIEVFIVW